MEEFRTFETLLCTPDAINQLAFKLFDTTNRGTVSFGKPYLSGSYVNFRLCGFGVCVCILDDFHYVLSHTTTHSTLPFDFNSTFVKQYFGTDKKHSLDYFEFCQLLQVRVASSEYSNLIP